MKVRQLFNPWQGNPMRVAIFMSGTGSNARKIIDTYVADRDSGVESFVPVLLFSDNPKSNAKSIAEEYRSKNVFLNVVCNDIRKFGVQRDKREDFDLVQAELLKAHNIYCVALAGYDWVVSYPLFNEFLTVNVHPGDLRVRGADNKRKYVGLGWVPSAKAVLAGEDYVHSCVHVVNRELDGGSLLRVSAGVPVNQYRRDVLLGSADSLDEVVKDVKRDPALSDAYPIVRIAKDLQERLKVSGDWVIFPRVIRDLSRGLYSSVNGIMHYGGLPIPNGVSYES
jgi:phosphoribosylglycinamide formyltransferase-1